MNYPVMEHSVANGGAMRAPLAWGNAGCIGAHIPWVWARGFCLL